MSIARHHAEWLSLVPVSGPFLSLPVLMEAFNTGLEPHDPEHTRLLRQEYANWQGTLGKRKADPAPHRNWINFVLTQTLDLDERVLAEGQAISQTLQVEFPEHHEFLRPSLVLVDPNTKKPRLLVQTYPRSQELTSYVANSPWKASPDTRMTELLHGTGVRLGLVTNGEHWMLVDAPKGETAGYASWYASLWLEEPITLRAFRSLLSANQFFNVPDDQTLEALLAKSASNQQEVTEQLGYQVRRAVEVLIHSLDRADQDFGRELLAGVKEDVLYESALTVMMRLVFLFCAEERELIPSKPFPVYEQNYSVSTISKQLRELADQHGEELLERRYDAWPRLLAAFRVVFGGLRHDDLYIPAYGGNLFNPDRFPFLEGRKLGSLWRDTEANPLPVNNRTVLHLLEALQLLQVKIPGGGPAEARRVSFRALDIEQIGHVYEGLLDHTAKRAAEPFLGLAGTRDKEPEVPLRVLEELAERGEGLETRGEDLEPPAKLLAFLKEQTGRSESALKKALAPNPSPLAPHFRTACQGDDALWQRVQPFAGLVRLDNFGYPVVIPKGSVFVTAGTDRRSSGTHYTPRSLTEPIVQYTLEPLVYVGPAEGKPKGEWTLKSAKELLDLKICDMACGSGAFLVQAARYMSERLLEAWDAAARNEGLGTRGEGKEVEIGGQNDGTVLPGTHRLAEGNGVSQALLPNNQDIPKGRTVRNDQSDSTISRFDSGEHCRGERPSAHEGISQSSEYRTGIIGGTGNAFNPEQRSGIAESGGSGQCVEIVGGNQPDAERSAQVFGGTCEIGGARGEGLGAREEIAGAGDEGLGASDFLVPNPYSRPSPLTPFPSPRITPDGRQSTGALHEELVPDDPDERKTYAMRIIAQRCLYGVDKNPLAAEMAKLSLWLLTVAKDKPFEFLDHAIRCGDSLVGLHDLEQLRHYSLKPDADDAVLFKGPLDSAVDEAINLRLKLEDLPVNTVEDIERQEQLLKEANEKSVRLRCAADLLVAAEFWGENAKDKQERVRHNAVRSGYYVENGPTEEFERVARKAWEGAREESTGARGEGLGASASLAPHPSSLTPFHWPLEFPEVIVSRGGFDAFVGNPPFIGGKKISGILGTNYREFLVANIARGIKGNADLSAYFFLRVGSMLREKGTGGLLATNTIAQGDTREVGLDQLTVSGFNIPRAVPSAPWPGVAALEISHVWLYRGTWAGEFYLNHSPTDGITPFLTESGKVQGKPFRLKANENKSFQGSIVLGMGFVLEPEQAAELIARNPKNKDCLFPYLNGEDLNSRPDQSPSRWVINFQDWPLRKGVVVEGLGARGGQLSWATADEKQRKEWLRSGIVPADYPGPVAADYPDLLAIVEEKVKPERTRKNANGEFQLRYPLYLRWWIYGDKRPELYATIAGMERISPHPQVFCGVLHSKYWSVATYQPNLVFSHALAVFTFFGFCKFSVLESLIHEAWALDYSGSLETRLRYTPSDCFETFPFPLFTPHGSSPASLAPNPSPLPNLDSIGEHYYQHRQSIMQTRQEGLTKTYNRFHNPEETAADIQKLRELHIEMDRVVALAYGWSIIVDGEIVHPDLPLASNPSSLCDPSPLAPLDLAHGFHETKQGIRYTISESARREVLQRLLKLNHERYAEEVAAGLHDKKASKPAASKKRVAKAELTGATLQADLFGDAQMGLFEDRGACTVERGPTDSSLFTDHAPRPTVDDPRSTALLDYLQNHPGWHSKDALIKGTGFPENRWNAAIKALLESGQVEREGEKRGARYRIKEVRGEG